jgi:hypothetical protein
MKGWLLVTTLKQIESNQRNALVATGPKTLAGKRRSAANSLTHGLRSLAPVIPGEAPAAWEKHRDGIVQSLVPANALETELAERAALLLWRLRRVTTHECMTVGGAVADTMAAVQHPDVDPLAAERKQIAERRESLSLWREALAMLRELPALDGAATVSKDFAQIIVEYVLNGAMDWLPGGPPSWETVEDALADEGEKGDDPIPEESEVFKAVGSPTGDWTAAQLRQCVAFVADKMGAATENLLESATRELSGHLRTQEDWVRSLETALLRKARQTEAQVAAHVGRHLLPESADLLMRYETHLNRQLSQTLQTLESLQAGRQGRRPPQT